MEAAGRDTGGDEDAGKKRENDYWHCCTWKTSRGRTDEDDEDDAVEEEDAGREPWRWELGAPESSRLRTHPVSWPKRSTLRSESARKTGTDAPHSDCC